MRASCSPNTVRYPRRPPQSHGMTSNLCCVVTLLALACLAGKLLRPKPDMRACEFEAILLLLLTNVALQALATASSPASVNAARQWTGKSASQNLGQLLRAGKQCS